MTSKGILDILTLKVISPASKAPYNINKGKCAIWIDAFKSVIRNGTTERGYWMYGFHNKPSDIQATYIDYFSFMSRRNELNMHPSVTYTTGERFNYLCLLRDKFVFGRFLSSLGFRTPEDLFVIDGKSGTIKDINSCETKPIEKLMDYNFNAFCKIVSGECGKGVFRLNCINRKISGDVSSFDELKNIIGDSLFVLQQTLKQHHEISAIYDNSVNTIRLITCRNLNGDVSSLPAIIRFGANGNVVDNWAAGGLVVAIDNQGILRGNAHYEFPVNGIVETSDHPDSHVSFDGIKIPYYKEAVNNAMELHKMLYGIPCIGWDIAITKDGPVFIEGNDNFEITLNQCAHGGLKKEWLQSIGSTPPPPIYLFEIKVFNIFNLYDAEYKQFSDATLQVRTHYSGFSILENKVSEDFRKVA